MHSIKMTTTKFIAQIGVSDMYLRVFIFLNESIHQIIEINAQTTCQNRNKPKKFIRFISKN